MTRIIAIGFAVFFLGLVALMASVTLFVREPMPILTTRVPVAIEQDGVRASVSVDGSYRFTVSAEGLPAGAADTLEMHRGEADGREVAVAITETGPGRAQGTGQFTAPGRWTLTLTGAGGPLAFGFVLQE